jgi:hypothetical protein
MAETRKCAGACGETKPLTPKYYQVYPTGYYSKVCKACLALGVRVRRIQNVTDGIDGGFTDWARFFRHYHLRQSFKGTTVAASNFDYDMLRALMHLQQFTCLVSGLQLVVPERTWPGEPKFPGWAVWRDTLTTEARQRTPELVRVTATNPWVPGNIILIANLWYDIYDRAGGLAECRTVCRNAAGMSGGPQQTLAVPSATAVATEVWNIRGSRIQSVKRCERPVHD